MYSDCSDQVLRHNVGMGCFHSVLRHSSQPPAGSELNNEKNRVRTAEIKPQFSWKWGMLGDYFIKSFAFKNIIRK